MDATIYPMSGASQHYTPPVAKPPADSTTPSTAQADAVTLTPIAAQASAVAGAPAPSSPDIQSQYEASARQAALSFKNVYAVSDQEFSIFKDATGKYITRYVSLRDGKVTYAPEPTLVKPIATAPAADQAHVAINA